MPYRRLPNTDISRIRAIKTALMMNMKTSNDDLAFSFLTLQKIQSFIPHFELAAKNQKQAFFEQSEKSKKYNEKQKKAKLYISHFIQVLNFTIARGELKPEAREFYQIGVEDKTCPILAIDSQIIEWGDKIIKGERDRMKHGGNPIYSPSIALVQLNFELFKEAYTFQKRLQTNSQRYTHNVSKMRADADELILNLWNEIEKFFSHIKDDSTRRQRSSEYGIQYVYRKNEKEKLQEHEELLFEDTMV